jgi:hypothetical protein
VRQRLLPDGVAADLGGQATAVKRALPCGDYGIAVAGRLIAAVERKSLADLVSSLITAKLRLRGRRSRRAAPGGGGGRGPLLAGLQTVAEHAHDNNLNRYRDQTGDATGSV